MCGSVCSNWTIQRCGNLRSQIYSEESIQPEFILFIYTAEVEFGKNLSFLISFLLVRWILTTRDFFLSLRVVEISSSPNTNISDLSEFPSANDHLLPGSEG